MAWYNKIFNREEKLNPAQPLIARDEGLTLGTTENFTHYANAYEQLEIVNRAVNMIVDDASEIPVDVGDKLALEPIYKNIRKSRNFGVSNLRLKGQSIRKKLTKNFMVITWRLY